MPGPKRTRDAWQLASESLLRAIARRTARPPTSRRTFATAGATQPGRTGTAGLGFGCAAGAAVDSVAFRRTPAGALLGL